MLESAFLERHTYNDSLESASNFNTRLLVERQSRLPFFDTQTNVAQVNSHGWRKACERQTSLTHGVVYTYHPRYWKKVPKPKKIPTPPPVETDSGMEGVVEPHPLMEPEEVVSPPEEPTPEDLSPASDDYEVYSDRKRKRQSRGAGARRSKDTRSRGSRSRKGSVVNTRSASSVSTPRGTVKAEEEPEPAVEETPVVPKIEPVQVTTQAEPVLQPDGKKKPSLFCDFCLGDNLKNKKSGGPEEMISCVDCGRSAHPTCLQFEGSLAANVKSYNWQCLECKSCSICGTSDHDDQLLFCDECDRGFHMYCLTPRIEKPPEGRWECHLCKK